VYQRCTYTLSSVADITAELAIPANTITLEYELFKPLVNEVVSDLTDRPSFSFGTSITLPGRDEEVVQLPFSLSIEDMLESTMSSTAVTGYDTFSKLIYANEANDLGENSVAWTQAISFHVELDNVEDRNDFRLDPLVMMVVAHSTASGNSVADSTTYLGTGSGSGQTGSSGTAQLDADFCGLNAGTAVGAMLLSDSTMFSVATQAEIDSYASADVAGKAALETTVKDRVRAQESLVPGNTVEAIPWGTYLTIDAATELARLALNNNMTADDIDFFANLPDIGNLDQSRYYFHDSTAGYMVPMRNRMRLSTGEGGGFEVRFCAITQVSTHRPMTIGVEADLYVSSEAAVLNSAVGTASEVPVEGITYYRPDSSRRRLMARKMLGLEDSPVVFATEAIVKRIPENAGTSMRPVTFQGEPRSSPAPQSNDTPPPPHSHNDRDNDRDNDRQNIMYAVIISVISVVVFAVFIYWVVQCCCPRSSCGSCGDDQQQFFYGPAQHQEVHVVHQHSQEPLLPRMERPPTFPPNVVHYMPHRRNKGGH